jgi:hypothetical protein
MVVVGVAREELAGMMASVHPNRSSGNAKLHSSTTTRAHHITQHNLSHYFHCSGRAPIFFLDFCATAEVYDTQFENPRNSQTPFLRFHACSSWRIIGQALSFKRRSDGQV